MTPYPQHQPPTLWKQAPNGQCAHIYEHIVARHTISFMREKGYFLVADFDVWANVYGATTYIETRFQTKSAQREFEKSLKSLVSITTDMIRHAAIECSAEYTRPIAAIELDTLLITLNALHSKPWRPLYTLTESTALQETSVNTAFSIDGLGYGDTSSESFHEVAIQYEAPKSIYHESPSLKALCALVIQSLALNQNAALGETLEFYDNGDEWAKGTGTVAYRVHLQTHNDTPLVKSSLETLLQENVTHLKNSDFAKHLAATVQKNYSDEASHYFTLHALNDITEGVIVGHKDWKRIATVENIQSVIDKLLVTVVTFPT